MNISPKVNPLWFWSNKVLPLVYDNSLSYYEDLCKAKDKINEIILFIDGELTDVLEPMVTEIIGNFFATAVYNSDDEEIEFTVEEEQNG